VKLLLLLLGASLLPAESVHSLLPEPGGFRVSSGLLLHWNSNPKDRARDAIEVFDRQGVRLFGIDIYRLLPSAQTVSIYDVAVRRNESIAIAAVSRGKGSQTRAWLLRLGWDGGLAHMTELDAANEIDWLDFDEAGNVWGLTDYEGEKVRKETIYNGTPCPLGPLILVFNPDGKIVKSLLKQADFPDGLHQAPDIGQVTFGLTNDRVWFWQPARHRMIITDREGSSIQKTSIRHAPAWNLGGLTLLTPTGDIIQDLHSPTSGVRGIYIVEHRRVEKLGPPQDASLIGIDGEELVFLRQINKTGDFLITRVNSLTELQGIAALVPQLGLPHKQRMPPSTTRSSEQ
jgi:hypothetical protein